MKKLENYGLVELNTLEMMELEGGLLTGLGTLLIMAHNAGEFMTGFVAGFNSNK